MLKHLPSAITERPTHTFIHNCLVCIFPVEWVNLSFLPLSDSSHNECHQLTLTSDIRSEIQLSGNFRASTRIIVFVTLSLLLLCRMVLLWLGKHVCAESGAHRQRQTYLRAWFALASQIILGNSCFGEDNACTYDNFLIFNEKCDDYW